MKAKDIEQMEGLIGTIVTSIITLIGVIVTVAYGNKLTMYRIEQLEKKQDKHNTLIERMYKVEKRLDVIDTVLKYDDKMIEAINNNNNSDNK